jgi:hypothetical protein
MMQSLIKRMTNMMLVNPAIDANIVVLTSRNRENEEIIAAIINIVLFLLSAKTKDPITV